MTDILAKAEAHKGTSFVEIYQNCNIFNDGAFSYMSERSIRPDAQVQLENGKLLIFGKDRDKGIALDDGLKLKVVNFTPGDEGAAESAGVIRYDSSNTILANMLAQMTFPEFPVPMGVFYQTERAVFEDSVHTQTKAAQAKRPLSGDINEDLTALFQASDTWIVS